MSSYKNLVKITQQYPNIEEMPVELLEQYEGWGRYADKIDKIDVPKDVKDVLYLSSLTAFYTPPEMAEALWQLVLENGKFCPKSILEPSCGTGRLLKLPSALQGKVENLCGIEIDPIAAAIAKKVEPRATVHNQRFESFLCEPESFDLVIGNIPFTNVTPESSEYSWLNPSIHEWFILKSLELLKPNGRLLFICSTYFLDKQDQRVRQYIAGRATLVAAWRFQIPEFPTPLDLLYFIKSVPKDKKDIDWVYTYNPSIYELEQFIAKTGQQQSFQEIANITHEHGGLSKHCNYYYLKRPEQILCPAAVGKDNYGKVAVVYQTESCQNIIEKLKQIRLELDADPPLPKSIEATVVEPEVEKLTHIPAELQKLAIGRFYEWQGDYYYRQGYSIFKVVSQTWHRKIQTMVEMAELVQQIDTCYNLFLDTQNESYYEKICSLQNKLAQAHKLFRQRWGYISPEKHPELTRDSRFYIILAAQNWQGQLVDRYSQPPRVPQPKTYHSLKDAYLDSLSRFGRVDLDWLAQQVVQD